MRVRFDDGAVKRAVFVDWGATSKRILWFRSPQETRRTRICDARLAAWLRCRTEHALVCRTCLVDTRSMSSPGLVLEPKDGISPGASSLLRVVCQPMAWRAPGGRYSVRARMCVSMGADGDCRRWPDPPAQRPRTQHGSRIVRRGYTCWPASAPHEPAHGRWLWQSFQKARFVDRHQCLHSSGIGAG